jgi:disulfide bond formation protein DsbB
MEFITHASIAARVALLVGVIPMIVGIAFAMRPHERWLALMRPLSLAGIFASVSNLFLGLANALRSIASNDSGGSAIQLAAVGLSEAAIFPFVGFACLAVAWLGIAIGMRNYP